MDWEFEPIRFISEPVEVSFDQPPVFEKRPICPVGFIWRGEAFRISEVVAEWQDYRRRGRMARNMQPAHAAHAESRGSWGVGLFYFRVRTERGRVFDIYYDRAPKDADQRKGSWYLFQELSSGRTDPGVIPDR